MQQSQKDLASVTISVIIEYPGGFLMKIYTNIAILMLYFWGLAFMNLSGCGNSTEKFDSNKWKNLSIKNGDSQRRNMVVDLTRNYLKIGMNKKDIGKILGKPDYGPDQYYLGVDGTSVGDPSCLSLEYDKNDRICKVSIVTRGVNEILLPNNIK